MSEKENKINIKEPLATISDRIIATIIDFLFVDAIFLVCLALPFALHVTFVFTSIRALEILIYILWPLMAVIAAVVSFAYFVYWPIRTNGLTFGKKAMGIRLKIIAEVEDGTLNFITKEHLILSLKRSLFSFVDMQLFGGLGIIFMNINPKTQTFADKQLKTIVVENEDLSPEEIEKKISKQIKKTPKAKKKEKTTKSDEIGKKEESEDTSEEKEDEK